MQYETTSCLVCNDNNSSLYSKKGQFGLPTHVVICKSCGFSYLNPRWTKERYDEFYRNEYDKFYRPEVINANDERYRYKSIEVILNRLRKHKVRSSFTNVLDIGAGMGHALIYLKEKQYLNGDADAIEPSDNCKLFLLKNKINHISGDVYSDWQKGKSNHYDFILMRHVLEHFHDPYLVLQKAREVLSENGLIYIAVPDAFFPTKPLRTHFFRIVHISYFSKNSLSNLLKKTGLNPIYFGRSDEFDRHEIFAICTKTYAEEITKNETEFLLQKNIYDKYGRFDTYYTLKNFLINILRKFRILN